MNDVGVLVAAIRRREPSGSRFRGRNGTFLLEHGAGPAGLSVLGKEESLP
jgi:hypothetical protein